MTHFLPEVSACVEDTYFSEWITPNGYWVTGWVWTNLGEESWPKGRGTWNASAICRARMADISTQLSLVNLKLLWQVADCETWMATASSGTLLFMESGMRPREQPVFLLYLHVCVHTQHTYIAVKNKAPLLWISKLTCTLIYTCSLIPKVRDQAFWRCSWICSLQNKPQKAWVTYLQTS